MAQLQKTPISASIYDGRNFQQIYDASHVISSNNLQQKKTYFTNVNFSMKQLLMKALMNK